MGGETRAQIDAEDLRALTHVSDTSLLTLFGRAEDSRSGGAIHDPTAERLADALVPVLAESDRPMHQRLAKRNLSSKHATYMGLRARHFDDCALDFLARTPGAIVVNMGCGLDSRFFRLRERVDDPASLRVHDVDLPGIIEVKRRVMPPEPGYEQIAADVTELSWLDALALERSAIFLAEGLLMYVDPEAVRALVVELRRRAPGSELVAEVFARRWLEGWRGRVLDRKLQGNFDVDASARFRFGVRDGHDIEGWAEGIEMLGEWSLFDERSPRLRGINWMGRFDGLRRLQWVVRWRLGR
jgi:methyltransferase (TIGR00027 family)